MFFVQTENHGADCGFGVIPEKRILIDKPKKRFAGIIRECGFYRLEGKTEIAGMTLCCRSYIFCVCHGMSSQKGLDANNVMLPGTPTLLVLAGVWSYQWNKNSRQQLYRRADLKSLIP